MADWAEETIIRLRVLWVEGHSTAEIARRLGVSKNAVVGKAHRLDLPGRPTPIRRSPDGERSRQGRTTVVRRQKEATLPPLPATGIVAPKPVDHGNMSPAARSAIVLPKAVAPAPVVLPRIFDHCQFALNDRRPWRWCDAPTKPGMAWCAEHYAICYHSRSWLRDRDEGTALRAAAA